MAGNIALASIVTFAELDPLCSSLQPNKFLCSSQQSRVKGRSALPDAVFWHLCQGCKRQHVHQHFYRKSTSMDTCSHLRLVAMIDILVAEW